MNELRCISLHQPWASLIAVGVKTIETRSRPTKVRGRIGIASTAKWPGHINIPPYRRGESREEHDQPRWLCIPTITDPAFKGPQPQGRHIPRRAQTPTLFWPGSGSHGRRWDESLGTSSIEQGSAMYLPLGALVATANLVDCVPIVSWAPLDGPATWAAHMIPLDPRSETPRSILVRDARVAAEALRDSGPLPAEIDATDQLPYGNYTPGRWAWLLDDIKPTSERCPACWGTGDHEKIDPLTDEIIDEDLRLPCARCGGDGYCEPIPVKGKQGFWWWQP